MSTDDAGGNPGWNDLTPEQKQDVLELAETISEHDAYGNVSRRELLGAAAALGIGGAVGGGGAYAAMGSAEAANGSVGTTANPVDVVGGSVDADDLRTNSRASPVIVHYDGTEWIANGVNGEIASGTDGASVINTALSNADNVRVVPQESGTTLSTSTTIDHTTSDKTLILENGVTLSFTGTGEAIEVSGNPVYLKFDTIDANGANYGIKDTGLGVGQVKGQEIVNAASRCYYLDSDNYTGGANARVEIQYLNCAGGTQTTPVGFEVPTPSSGSVEGYTWDIDVIFHPTSKGFILGGSGSGQGVRYHTVKTDVDASSGGATVLAEIWDEYNDWEVTGYVRSTGNRDVIIGPDAAGSSVYIRQEDPSNPLRVRRETPYASVIRAIDKFGTSYIEFDTELAPYSLTGFQTNGSGTVQLNNLGSRVEHKTGSTDTNRANIRQYSDYDYGLATFDNYSMLQVDLNLQDDSNQTIYVVHGDRGGQGYGFKIVDGSIKNWSHDGSTENTSSATTFTAAATVELTALFNGPDNVVYWVDGSKTGEHTSNLPSGTSKANQWSIDVQTNEAAEKEVRWTNWRGKVINT